MNILDFVNQTGKVKVACGLDFKLSYIKQDSNYPIVGYVIWETGHKSLMAFDVDGYPEDRRTHHGIHLVPCVPVTTYKTIDTSMLLKYSKIQELMKDVA